jgi:SPP1 family predicted phage head-tail adaptor
MLDLRVTLYEPTITVNASGQATKGWSSAGTFYAERIVNENGGSESMPYDQMVSAGMYLWRLRYPNTVKPNWKLEYNSEDYDIISVLPEGRRRYIIIKSRLRDNGTR